jgi:hypothetical protein
MDHGARKLRHCRTRFGTVHPVSQDGMSGIPGNTVSNIPPDSSLRF